MFCKCLYDCLLSRMIKQWSSPFNFLINESIAIQPNSTQSEMCVCVRNGEHTETARTKYFKNWIIDSYQVIRPLLIIDFNIWHATFFSLSLSLATLHPFLYRSLSNACYLGNRWSNSNVVNRFFFQTKGIKKRYEHAHIALRTSNDRTNEHSHRETTRDV